MGVSKVECFYMAFSLGLIGEREEPKRRERERKRSEGVDMEEVSESGPAIEKDSKRRIIIAMDEGEESIHALSWAVKNLRIGHCRDDEVLVLLHVQPQPPARLGPDGSGFFVTPEIIDLVKKHQDDASDRVLVRAKQICDENKVPIETMVAHGDPRDAICEAVETLQATYLIVGSRGHGAIKRALLGSVSDYCAHNAKCPVVIVKLPDSTPKAEKKGL